MVYRRAFLGLVGSTALGVLGGYPTSAQTDNGGTHPGQFSRISGDIGGNMYGISTSAPVRDIDLSWRRSFDTELTPLVGPDNNLYLLFDNGRILSLNTGGETYEMSLINRMPNAIINGLIHGTYLFVVDEENTMAAFDVQSADRLWQRTHTTGLGEPVYANGDLYYPTDVPSVLRVDPENGQELDEITPTEQDNGDSDSDLSSSSVNDPMMVVTEPGSRDTPSMVYGTIPSHDGGIFAYRTDSNSNAWTRSIESMHARTVAVPGALFAVSDTGIHCLDPQTGDFRWQRSRELPSAQISVVTSETMIVWTDDQLIALDPSSGDLRWESGLQALGPQAVIGSGDMIYVIIGTNELTVVGLDAASGTERWRRPFCDGNSWNRPALTDQFLLIPADETLYAFAEGSAPRQSSTTETTPAANNSSS